MQATQTTTPRTKPLLYRAEVILLALTLLVALGAVTLSAVHTSVVVWRAFAEPLVACILLFLLALYIRAKKPMERLALFAAATAIFIGFAGFVAIFIHLMFPFSAPMIDKTLIGIDAMIGFHWADFVTALGQFPWLGRLLSYVYLGAIPQLLVAMAVLAYLRRVRDLHRFLLVGQLAMLTAAFIWWLAPGIGTTAVQIIPADLAVKINLVADNGYAAALARAAAVGFPVIAPDTMMGVITFPSFHLVMALMVVWFLARTAIFVPVLVLNALMVPATLVHGAHHLVDLVAGAALFALCVWVSAIVIPAPKGGEQG